ncbi:glutathione S-transferase N-terminal domain-containing protein [Phenylobacterium sp.]|uniref:glutathione S-transferase N-terminal domain-containing protein n=1 Tax=Phenylobacterium sp. TaxID=1871053 RepID=UPI00301CC906
MSGSGSPEVVLYGAPASLYTAKVRAFLRVRRVAYVERFPSHPRYREVIKPAVESHRIPVAEFADGAILQDSTEILDELERRYPDPVTASMGPRQALATHLLEVVGDRGVSKPAMHFRWSFLKENEDFLVGEFGRSLRFPAPAEEIARLGRRVASKMSGYLPMLGIEPRTIPAIERVYGETLALLDDHFAHHPYFLGGAPSRADYAMMGPLYGHLGRDPKPLHLMQRTAPLVYRWTERINGAEVETPEFPDRRRALPEGDEIPPTLVAFLRHVFRGYAEELVLSAGRLNALLAASPGLPPGGFLSPEGADQPVLGAIVVDYHGVAVEQQALGHALWILQRALDYVAGLEGEVRATALAFADEIGAGEVLALRFARRLTRSHGRLAVA